VLALGFRLSALGKNNYLREPRPEKLLFQFRAFNIQVTRHVGKNCAESAEPQAAMIGNRDMVRMTTEARLQSNVAPYLSSAFVALPLQQPDKFVTGKITRQSQAEMTSSLTMCRRITGGDLPSSKWQRTASRTFDFKSSMVSAWVKME
jgi:hypothetical protein